MILPSSAGFHPEPGAPPVHLGIIPDGGRRWARQQGCSLEESYRRTRELLQAMPEIAFSQGFQEISIYLSSIQNFRRKPGEMETNLRLVESSLVDHIPALANELGCRIVVAGHRSVLPASLKQVIRLAEETTASASHCRLNLLIAYDPVEEILQAIRKCADPAEFRSHLWVTTPVDLIIRSGNAPLLSNFLPLQSGFARTLYLDQLFNEITPEMFSEILSDFQTIPRKFGN